VASFPGSGAEMFRQVIETITLGRSKGWSIYDGGTDAGDNQNATTTTTTTCHSLHAATCKTHWPVLPQHSPSSSIYRQQYAPQAIVLLRNPAAAFSSRFNHLWELRRSIKFHSQQAPEKAWKKWIAKNFQQQWIKYQLLIQTWATDPHYHVSLYIPYEGLTDPVKGPQWTQRVAQLLQDQQQYHDDNHTNPTTHEIHQVVAHASDIPCLWRLAVLEQPRVKRQGHAYVPAYTTKQQQALLQMMDELIVMSTSTQQQQQVAADANHHHHSSSSLSSLVQILSHYRQEIATHTRIVDNNNKTVVAAPPSNTQEQEQK
jgi:hypothetical protein